MRKQLLRLVAFCATCLVLGAQAQTSSGSSGGSSSDQTGSSSSPGSSGSPSSSYGSSSSQSGLSGRNLSATGRMMGHQELRASQLTGAQVVGSSGTEVGTISDTIINPVSGRIDFAVISISGGAGSTGSSTGSATSTTSGTSAVGTTGSAASASGKQVAVPWMLLRPSATAGTGSSSATSSAGQQASFTFSGDTTKLQSAPNFDATTDLTQPSWRQSVFSYFGLSGAGSATGGAESPGSSGSSSGLSTPDTSGSTSSGSSSSSTPPNSGSSNP